MRYNRYAKHIGRTAVKHVLLMQQEIGKPRGDYNS